MPSYTEDMAVETVFMKGEEFKTENYFLKKRHSFHRKSSQISTDILYTW